MIGEWPYFGSEPWGKDRVGWWASMIIATFYRLKYEFRGRRWISLVPNQRQKEIAACTESRFFPLFATNFMYSLMHSLLKIAVSRISAKIIAKSFCPCSEPDRVTLHIS